jgi:hypothetical protein
MKQTKKSKRRLTQEDDNKHFETLNNIRLLYIFNMQKQSKKINNIKR